MTVGRAAELLDAAVAEFVENGYAAVGVREITERAGVSHGTFYNYFDSKRHMLSVLIDRDTAVLLDRLSSGSEELDDPATVRGLRAAVLRANGEVLRAVEERLELYRFLLVEVPGVDAEAFDGYLRLYREAALRCAAILEPAAAAGLIDGQLTVEFAAEAWLGYLLGVVAAKVNDLDETPADDAARVVTDLLLSGGRRPR